MQQLKDVRNNLYRAGLKPVKLEKGIVERGVIRSRVMPCFEVARTARTAISDGGNHVQRPSELKRVNPSCVLVLLGSWQPPLIHLSTASNLDTLCRFSGQFHSFSLKFV